MLGPTVFDTHWVACKLFIFNHLRLDWGALLGKSLQCPCGQCPITVCVCTQNANPWTLILADTQPIYSRRKVVCSPLTQQVLLALNLSHQITNLTTTLHTHDTTRLTWSQMITYTSSSEGSLYWDNTLGVLTHIAFVLCLTGSGNLCWSIFHWWRGASCFPLFNLLPLDLFTFQWCHGQDQVTRLDDGLRGQWQEAQAVDVTVTFDMSCKFIIISFQFQSWWSLYYPTIPCSIYNGGYSYRARMQTTQQNIYIL